MPRLKQTTPLLLFLLTGCVSLPPEGPSVMALPGSGQRFEQFRADDALCRDFARQAISPRTPESAATDAAVASSVVGTAAGAAVGGAINGSSGAAVGAGVGLLAGSASGVAASNASSQALQQRYDQTYLQCMYARGQKVPLIGSYPVTDGNSRTAPARDTLPPVPPPPRGAPPPPPAR